MLELIALLALVVAGLFFLKLVFAVLLWPFRLAFWLVGALLAILVLPLSLAGAVVGFVLLLTLVLVGLPVLIAVGLPLVLVGIVVIGLGLVAGSLILGL